MSVRHAPDPSADAFEALFERIAVHLRVLADDIGPRPSGSSANRRAADYVAAALERSGYWVERLPFETRHWTPGPATVWVDGERHELPPSPFSQSCDVTGRVSIIERWPVETEPAGPGGHVILCRGELTAQPWFPVHFPFVSIPEQQTWYGWLERTRPLALMAAAHDVAVREPLIEDGDLRVPYATVPAPIADRIAGAAAVRLRVEGEVTTGSGVNLGATRLGRLGSVLLSAHLDSKVTTPGALDNGGGVAALLALVETGLLPPEVEVVFFNGEDHYAAPGEQAWLASHEPTAYRLVVNVDGVGYRRHPTGVALMNIDGDAAERIREMVAGMPAAIEDAPWYESDHAIFVMAGVPTVALTSAAPDAELQRVSHGPEGGVDAVDPAVVAGTATFVSRLVAASRVSP